MNDLRVNKINFNCPYYCVESKASAFNKFKQMDAANVKAR